MRADTALLHLAPTDQIAVALRDIAAGETLAFGNGTQAIAAGNVPFGFKVAVCAIAPGEKVYKYRVPIGSASTAIAAGEMVHVHNLRSDYIPTQRR